MRWRVAGVADCDSQEGGRRRGFPITLATSNQARGIAPPVSPGVSCGIVKTETSTDSKGDSTRTDYAPQPSFTVDMTQGGKDWPGQEDRQGFYLPIHGFVWFYPDELKIIDHPAFQRHFGNASAWPRTFGFSRGDPQTV
jgi:hypothetical protein